LELQARPVNGLDLIAGFGYTDTEVDDWVATEFNKGTSRFEQYDYTGNDLPNAPEYTYNLGVQYRHQCGFFGRADLLGIGNFYFDAKNKLKENAYQIVNLRMGYEGESFDIILWCKNLFDKEFETMKVNWGGNELGQDGEPRMFGVKMTYRF
jgi:iron complex outermembrane receptor protein